HRQVDHDEVVRLRHAHPDESLETIARRLGCSLSTVKRHLRRERRDPGVRREEPPKPGLSAVLAAAAAVTGWPRNHLAA
ncbi:MAG TPA: helix-turn-helix domain-containing protein, partial [Propionibacteriaceae bacterium]|nr:helix-turn-helix domain-containing protein [Propionibacteriaceae bacterium]